jgi:hypothetical protein
METTQDTQPNTELFVGSDKVVIEGDHVVIHATEAMDWRLREFSKVPIWFREQKYDLRSKRAGQAPRAFIYELVPWPEDLHGAASSQSVFYDEDYVKERNRLARSVRGHDRMYPVLAPFYPLLGFAWSDFKNTTLARCGFDPEAITSASVYLTMVLFMVESFFTTRAGCGIVTMCFGSRSYLIYDLGLMVLLGVDIRIVDTYAFL